MSDSSESENDNDREIEPNELIGPQVVNNLEDLQRYHIIFPPNANEPQELNINNQNANAHANNDNVNDLNIIVARDDNDPSDSDSNISEDIDDPNANIQNDYMSDGDGNDSDVWDNASSGHENESGADDANSDGGAGAANDDDDDSPQFDQELPMRHQYLGNEMAELQGRILLDEGSILEVPIALMSFHLVPGQTLPLTVFHPVFQNALRRCIVNDRLFGIVNAGMEESVPDGRRVLKRNAFGTLAEIYEFQEEDSDQDHQGNNNNNQLLLAIHFAIKAKGRQRFNVLEVRRQADGNLMGKICIRPEIILSPMLDNNWFTCGMRYVFPDLINHTNIKPDPSAGTGAAGDNLEYYEKSFNALVTRNAAKREATRFKSAYTPWPAFLYELYDEDILVERIHRKLQNELKGLMESGKSKTNIPLEGAELGFWLAMNLTMEDNVRLEILKLDCPIQRLRYELSFLEKVSHSICCRHCSRTIADQKEIFSMSIEGPQGTFVNPSGYVHETVTVHQVMNVVNRGLPSTEASWFPGYAWTVIECRFCRKHLGWKFKATGRLQPKKFWGLSRQSVTMKYSVKRPNDDDTSFSRRNNINAVNRADAEVIVGDDHDEDLAEYNRHAIIFPPLPPPPPQPPGDPSDGDEEVD